MLKQKSGWGQRAGALCLIVLLLFCVAIPASAAGERVIPGGIPFGVRFTTDGILVVGFCETAGGENPARTAGLRPRDILTALDGVALTSAADLSERVNEGGGMPLTLTYRRGDTLGTVTLTPIGDGKGGYRTGLYVRDSGAGIGTVTFLLPENNAFAGLGHGICDTETGALLPLRRGNVLDVTVSGITPGTPGTPGELHGYFTGTKVGTLLGNTPEGVFGLYASMPRALEGVAAVTVAAPEEIKEGQAILLCTLSDNTRQAFTVEISNIDTAATGAKCFTIRVTDPDLLRQTGGIVQGMSGSPLLQNGKLIGAVTHVMISNPTLGYGIFIDNMLAALPERLHP